MHLKKEIEVGCQNPSMWKKVISLFTSRPNQHPTYNIVLFTKAYKSIPFAEQGVITFH